MARKLINFDEDLFIDLDADDDTWLFMQSLIPLRAGIYVDPGIFEPWSCDPERCRPLLGRNLCCKVQLRCTHLFEDKCRIHERKPFSCALFPLDLFRIGKARVILSAKNPIPHAKYWSRYDRDMLRCFEGDIQGPSMYDVQRGVLERVFTQAELNLVDELQAELVNSGKF